MTDKPSEKAMALVDGLLTNGLGDKGARLMIVSLKGKDLGGWGPLALALRIDDFTEAARREENEATCALLARASEVIGYLIDMAEKQHGAQMSARIVQADIDNAIAARRRP